MDALWGFQHIGMPPGWLEAPIRLTLRQAFHSPGDLLRRCLLEMDPFRECQENEVRDPRPIPGRNDPCFACHNRPLLVQALVEALLIYELALAQMTYKLQTLPWSWRQSLDNLRPAGAIYA